MDAVEGGAFLSLDVAGAKVLIDKIASNKSWKGDRQLAHAKGIHEIDSVNVLAAKMDLLMEKLESPHQEVNQTMEPQMKCEKCGNTGHSGKSCPFTQEDENSIGNNTPNDSDCRPQQGWNSKPNLHFDQQQETKVTQLASSCLNHDTGKLSGQPEVTPKEIVSAVAVRVLTYAKYLKDILGNKRVLPITEVVHLTDECSTAILNPLLEKKKNPGCPTITCSIRAQHFKHALCDLRASISVMSKLADQSVRHLAGITKDIPMKIRNFFVPIDFVILDMEINTEIPLISGRPFLSMTTAHIDSGIGVIQLNINGQKERFGFRPKDEQCSQIKSFKWKESVKELEKPYFLIEFVENLQTREEIKAYNQRNAKRNIQHKIFLEFGKKEIKVTLPTQKV
ncbi:uncharacterized protein LOC120667846 [Panicum virgatum]|uniref:uncharacterized protein LOC120667846 n=1 Tax=Panicum virgatum TaxID=38727 RepID=UPI0019D50CB4|nr:uncharacterized protein LOC120667846 [Panicum virgatum]